MSATTRPISLHTREPAPTTARPLALTIRWDISPRALLERGRVPLAACPPVTNYNQRPTSAALLWHIDRLSARAELALDLTDAQRHAIPLSPAIPIAITRDPATDLLHIDAADALHLTIRGHADEPILLFARTPLLTGALSLPGGVYDAPTLSRPG